jgi:pseudaminic acid synthase
MSTVHIGERAVGTGHPVWIVAELGGNAGQDYRVSIRLVHAAHKAGADAVKTACFTPDSMAYPGICRLQWQGKEYDLYDLYRETAMPMEWHAKLKETCDDLGMVYFASVFSAADCDLMESVGVPCYKIASFEITDLPLIRYVASKGKPLILSTGMATLGEIDAALAAAANGPTPILLKCASAYPAPPSAMNLETIGALAYESACPVGLSDHTLGWVVPVAAVALGACVIEKHLTLSRADGGPDAAHSLEPHEFAAMVEAIRVAEQAIGTVQYGPTEDERPNLRYRRSLWVVKGIRPGERITAENVRSLRPADGLEPRYLPEVLARRARVGIDAGTALTADLLTH